MAEETATAEQAIFLTVPPKKIACGFYQTAVVSNSEGQGKEQVFAWGRNRYCALGIKTKDSEAKKTFSGQGENIYDPKTVDLPGRVYEVSCGTSHSAFLVKSDPDAIGGELYMTGLGIHGRVGARDPKDQDIGDAKHEVEDIWSTADGPILTKFPQPLGNSSILRVVCGADHTLCLANDGRLYAFGSNAEGQCGQGSVGALAVYFPEAIQFSSGRPIIHFAAGAQHSLAAVDGELWAWGSGRNGRLGLGRSGNVSTPMQVGAAADKRIVFVACGEAHSGAVDAEGRVLMWGAGSYGRLGHGGDIDAQVPKVLTCFGEMSDTPIFIKSIALGGFHSMFLPPHQSARSNGKLYGCGSGAACGVTSEVDTSIVEVPQAVADSKVFGRAMNIVQVAAGMFHSLVLMQSGDVWTWGVGANGRLGLGEARLKSFFEPQLLVFSQRFFSSLQLPFFDASEMRGYRKALAHSSERSRKEHRAWDVKQLGLGSLHSCLLTEGGRLYMWGCNANGQLGAPCAGNYQWVPRELSFGQRLVKEVVAGYDHCLAVTMMRELWAWGKGASGQLGTGYARDEEVPKHVEHLTQVIYIGAGEEHSAAIVRNDRGNNVLYTWGSAESGMLGLGGATISGINSTPAQVTFPALARRPQPSDKVSLSARLSATAPAIGDVNQSFDAAKIGPLIVRCGQNHTAVIVGPNDSQKGADLQGQTALFTFGSGWYGKLGLGDDQNKYSPQQVIMHNVFPKDVSLGAYHSTMLSTAHDIYIWGRNKMCCAPMGSDHVKFPTKFVHIDGQPKIRSVVCGEQQTLVVTMNHELFVWGDNKGGQLGIGATFSDASTPEQVEIGQVDFVSTGNVHSMVKAASGEILAWGTQTCGRLGLADKKQERVCWEAEKVRPVWASIESMSKPGGDRQKRGSYLEGLDGLLPEDAATSGDADLAAVRAGDGPDGAAQAKLAIDGDKKAKLKEIQAEDDRMTLLLVKQVVTSFSTMQVLIKREDPQCREGKLKELEQKLQMQFQAVISSIKALPAYEGGMNRLIGDIEQSLKGNLFWLKVQPLLPSESKVDPLVASKLPIYQKLFAVLQQQVTYLAQLSTCVKADSDAKDFYRFVQQIFFSEYHPRAQNLFLMLLRLMMDKETEASDKDVFSTTKSRAFHIFKNYALSGVHYTDIIHKYFSSKEKDSLLMKTKEASDITTFAMTLTEFKVSLDDAKKDPQEVQMEYQISLEALCDFLQGPFLDSITSVDLPIDIQQLLGKAKEAVQIRQFHSSEAERNTPADRALLRLFCNGILCPILKETSKYVSKVTYLSSSAALIRTDATLEKNLTVLAQFLEHMVEGSWDSKEHKVLSQIAKTKIGPALSEYIHKQAEISSNIEVDLMQDAYMYHFERTRHPVNMATSDCLRISNMLKLQMNKLRIKESDELERWCKELPEWPSELIERLDKDRDNDHMHNFVMNTRFMFDCGEGDVVIDRATRCPMPRNLAGQISCEGLLQPYQMDANNNPRRALESLFRELEEIKSKDFKSMKEEFKTLSSIYRQKSPPNYEMVQHLQDGLRMVEELVNVEAHAEDVLEFMSSSLATRAKHRKYLLQVEGCLVKIQAHKMRYEGQLKMMLSEYQQLHHFSLDLQLPKQYLKKEQEGMLKGGARGLKFSVISKEMVQKRALALNPKDMNDLGCLTLPVETRSLKELMKQNIVCEVHQSFHVMQKRMRITFRALSEGGVEIVINVLQPTAGLRRAQSANMNAVKTLTVSKEKLMEMRRAEEGVKVALGNDGEEAFIWVVCSKFCELITNMNKQGLRG